MRINAEKLFEPILKVAEFNNRGVLTKACWNTSKKELVATDGRRLVVVLTKTRPEGKYTTPKSKDGIYPSYSQVIPGYREGRLPKAIGYDGQESKHVTVTRKDIIPKLEQALAVLKGGRSEAVACHFIHGTLQLCCSQPDVSSMHYEGANEKNKQISLSARYFYELVIMFHTLGEDKFEFHVTDELSPVVLIGKEVYAVLMLMRVTKKRG